MDEKTGEETKIKWSLELGNISWFLRLWIAWQVIRRGKLRLDSDIVPDIKVTMNPHYREEL